MTEQLRHVFERIAEFYMRAFTEVGKKLQPYFDSLDKMFGLERQIRNVLMPKELRFYLHGKKRVRKKYRNLALRRISKEW